eukprot:5904746-Amphidinium_carterae.1
MRVADSGDGYNDGAACICPVRNSPAVPGTNAKNLVECAKRDNIRSRRSFGQQASVNTIWQWK